MSTIPLTIDAETALRAVQGHVRNMNQGRRIPKLPSSIETYSQKNKVYIFNIGPWDHSVEMGSLGTFFIPKRVGEYSAMTPLAGIVTEPIPINEKEFELRQEEGRYIAEQIIGIGKMRDPANSLLRFGVFIAAGDEPTKKELSAAREALQSYYMELIVEARESYAKGPDEAKAAIRETHRIAAREMNLTDEPWLQQISPEARITCDMCGTKLSSTVVVCPTCTYVLNPEKYEKMKSRLAK